MKARTPLHFKRQSRNTTSVSALLTDKKRVQAAPADPLKKVVGQMLAANCGAAGIVKPDGRLVGLLTEREILRRIFQSREAPPLGRLSGIFKTLPELTAFDVMIPGPDCLYADTDIRQALAHISAKQYHHMPVIDTVDSAIFLGTVNERDLFHATQKIHDREMADKDLLLGYLMHHESYGAGNRVQGSA